MQQQSIKIYKINKDSFRFKDLPSNEEKISKIVRDTYVKYKNTEKFDINSIPKYAIDNLTYYLFVYNFAEKESDWSNFLPVQLVSGVQLNTRNLTLLLFICDEINMFVVVGGKGYEAIIPFIDHSFGLTVLSKVLNPNEDIIVSINSRGLTGSRSGVSEQYRSEFRLIDYIRFGKVPVEVHLMLSNLISDEFFKFLQSKDKERIRIYAGKSFKIKKNLSFDELHKVIIELGFILERVENDYLTTYIEIKDERRINQDLQPLLINALYDDRENVLNPNTTNKRFKFDFCDPNKMTQFYEADYYVLKERQEQEGIRDKYIEFKTVEHREDIYNAVIRRAIDKIDNIDLIKFRNYIQGVRICSYSDNKLSTSANFIYHFTTEFDDNGKAIFLVDTKWYILNASFITDLKYECVQALKNHKLPKHILDLPWSKSIIRTEGLYNLQYNTVDNYIVFDTHTPEGIELCDVMYIEDDKIYLIHVKYGFDASLRELDNQISLSSRRLNEDLKSSKFEYIDKVYESAKGKSITLKKYTKEEFRTLLQRKIIYVFAFSSQLYHDRLVEDSIEDYRSNIARYSLIKCTKDMLATGFEINLCQIRQK